MSPLCESCKNCEFLFKEGVLCRITNSKRSVPVDCDFFEPIETSVWETELAQNEKRLKKWKKWTVAISVIGLIPIVIYIPASYFLSLWRPGLFLYIIEIMGLMGFVGLIMMLTSSTSRMIKLVFLGSGVLSYIILFVGGLITEGHKKSFDYLVVLIIGIPYFMMAIQLYRIYFLQQDSEKEK